MRQIGLCKHCRPKSDATENKGMKLIWGNRDMENWAIRPVWPVNVQISLRFSLHCSHELPRSLGFSQCNQNNTVKVHEHQRKKKKKIKIKNNKVTYLHVPYLKISNKKSLAYLLYFYAIVNKPTFISFYQGYGLNSVHMVVPCFSTPCIFFHLRHFCWFFSPEPMYENHLACRLFLLLLLISHQFAICQTILFFSH